MIFFLLSGLGGLPTPISPISVFDGLPPPTPPISGLGGLQVVCPCILLVVHQDHELLHQGKGGGLPQYTVTGPPRS